MKPKRTLLFWTIAVLVIIVCVLAALASTDGGKNAIDTMRPKVFGPRTVESVVRAREADVLRSLQAAAPAAMKEGFPALLFILADKSARAVTLYGRNAPDAPWTAIKAYPFTGYSGRLGPKLREGDLQIPEGDYALESLNPNSRFHLALRVAYPNAFDRAMAARDGRADGNLGGDIMIHGRSATIGCIPVGDSAIEEIFVMAAKAGVGNVRILIVPCDPRAGEMPKGGSLPAWYPELWANLRAAAQTLGAPPSR